MQAFRMFIEGLRSDFDWIIIDSPPVMAVADTSVLARGATGVLFVTSAERTSLEAAETALNELHAAGRTSARSSTERRSPASRLLLTVRSARVHEYHSSPGDPAQADASTQ